MMADYKTMALRFFRSRSGQDLIEYALVAGFVAVAAAAIFPTTLAPSISGIFSKLNVYFTQAASQGS